VAGRLGLIAGGGGLPAAIVQDCAARGRDVFLIRLKGFSDASLAALPGEDSGLAEFGRSVKALKRAECRSVCLAGIVHHPDFKTLKPDLLAMKHLPRVIAAAGKGDDALLRAVLGAFELEGFAVEGSGQAAPGLLLGRGPLGSVSPGPEQAGDIEAALKAAREVGRTDIAQGAVARDGEVIAREGRGGTDAMLKSLAAGEGLRRGVLAKLPKPGQDLRVDLPTIGVGTIEHAAAAGLAGVVGQSDGMLVVGRPAVREAADRLGLFVMGLEPEA
jgi:DUF1009 family protein